MQVEGGNELILVLHEPEGLKGEAGALGLAILLHLRLCIASTSGGGRKDVGVAPTQRKRARRSSDSPDEKVVVFVVVGAGTRRGVASVKQHVEPSATERWWTLSCPIQALILTHLSVRLVAATAT